MHAIYFKLKLTRQFVPPYPWDEAKNLQCLNTDAFLYLMVVLEVLYVIIIIPLAETDGK